SAGLAPAAKEMAERLSALGPAIDRRLEAVAGIAPSGMKSRIHGDYHLGQVLVSEQDLFIIDFEGEPRRTLAERCAKNSPLRDVAGMLRSFDYAAWAAVRQVASRLPDQARDSASLARHWRDRMTSEFLAGYFPATEGARNLPEEADARQALLDLFLLQKGFYEINYELSNRPDWVGIPIQGMLDLIEGGAA
ncbi:phosphotransferase, partial [Nitratireductor sp. GCM10026969]|uniref:phosphotransferase n=1 Tax=Nitratireductor sp. GCM10026969 TaxID=3252645 RepID=UPI003624223B